MRAYLPDYELRTVQTLADALQLLSHEPGQWKPFAGGTDLMVLLEFGKLEHRKFFDIWKLQELKGIEVTPEYVTLGALATYTEIQKSALLRSEFPMLCKAASETGGIAIQNRGTLGGNIANASPAADSPPALLAYGAEIELASVNGRRWVQYSDFHTGYKQMIIRPDELITRIRLPRIRSGELKQFYRKVGTRKAQAISKVCFAAMATVEDGMIGSIRVSLGSVAPTVIRCPRTEALLESSKLDSELIEEAKKELGLELSPIDDMRSTAGYRLKVSQNLLGEFLESLADGDL